MKQIMTIGPVMGCDVEGAVFVLMELRHRDPSFHHPHSFGLEDEQSASFNGGIMTMSIRHLPRRRPSVAEFPPIQFVRSVLR